MGEGQFFSRSTDHIGLIGKELRDLTGFSTLTYELVQNADDAGDATRIVFDLREDALVVENDGSFTDCGRQESLVCPWLSERNPSHRCDFHSFRTVAGADKRQREGTTGAFGVGFIAVYQVTDRPELISSGRHWAVDESASEDKRIDATCGGCADCSGVIGTRFILPWALDPESRFRKALRAQALVPDAPERLFDELQRVLPTAMVFLKRLDRAEVRRDGQTKMSLEKVADQGSVIISDGISDRTWLLLEGDFDHEASRLKSNHGEIEGKRSSSVAVAIPMEAMEGGRLCAGLPTQYETELQFHVNADFFPSSDRKKIIFEEDYQSEWNRAAIRGAAATFAQRLDGVREALGPERLWGVIHSLGQAALAARVGHLDAALADFWEAFVDQASEMRIFMNLQGEWCSADDVLVLESESEANFSEALTALGLSVLHPDIRLAYFRHRYTEAFGLRRLGAAHVAEAFQRAGLTRRTKVEDMPGVLSTPAGLSALWQEVLHLITRSPKASRAAIVEQLSDCSLAPGVDGALWPCKHVYRADSEAIRLFGSLDASLVFLQERALGEDAGGIGDLCRSLGVRAAVEVLEGLGPDGLKKKVSSEAALSNRLLAWFEQRMVELKGSAELRQRLAALPIYPAADRHDSLTNLSLPGDFKDPLGLAAVVDVDRLGQHRDLLYRLGASDLSLPVYVRNHIPRAFEDPELPLDRKRGACELLAGRLGEIRDSLDLQRLLASLPLVECEDGHFRSAEEVYFHSDEVAAVLGEGPNFARFSTLDQRSATGDLLRWLGVADKPRDADVLERIRAVAQEPPGRAGVATMQRVVEYLGKSFGESLPARWSELRSLEWLPAAEGDRWYRPEELHTIFLKHLYESQARFLDFTRPVQQASAKFLNSVGVGQSPSAAQIVDHLLWCVREGQPVNRDIYRRLDDNHEDPSIRRLRGEKCLALDSGEVLRADEVFWSDPGLGRFRRRLSDSFRSFGQLLGELGVKDAPDHVDALSVLDEIADVYGSTNSPIEDADDYLVVVECWRRLNVALVSDEVAPRRLAELASQKVVPNNARVLTRPDRLFFEDRAGLAAKFDRFLEGNVIPRSPDTWGAMSAAGVNDLSCVVSSSLVEAEQPLETTEIGELLQDRQRELARVLAAHLEGSAVSSLVAAVADLRCRTVLSLKVQWNLSAFQRDIPSEVESVAAYYSSEDSWLYFVPQEGGLPWGAIARELALIWAPHAEPGAVAPGIKEVLSASSVTAARGALDDLGLRSLEIGPQTAPSTAEVEGDLGGDSPPTQDPTSAPVPSQPEDEQGAREGSPSLVGGSTPEHAEDEADFNETPDSATNGKTSSGSSGRKSPNGARISRGKLRTYVTPGGQLDERETNPDVAQRRSEIEHAGVMRVLEYERGAGRDPLEMPPLNEGYDIESRDGQGNLARYIEVKSLRATWSDTDAPGLTRPQFKRSEKEGEAFWLYVVERALEDDYAIYCICNPGQTVNQFVYDPGWRSLAHEVGHKTAQEAMDESA